MTQHQPFPSSGQARFISALPIPVSLRYSEANPPKYCRLVKLFQYVKDKDVEKWRPWFHSNTTKTTTLGP